MAGFFASRPSTPAQPVRRRMLLLEQVGDLGGADEKQAVRSCPEVIIRLDQGPSLAVDGVHDAGGKGVPETLQQRRRSSTPYRAGLNTTVLP